MSVRVLTGDCRDIMRAMESDSIDCIVTSPPYWGLRDYGITGQLGLEASLGEHIATMVDVFEAAKRVLKKSGTLWLNYGDCYAASVNGRAAADTKAIGNDDRTFRDKPFSTVGPIYDPSIPNVLQTKHANGVAPQGRIRAGGYLKPKDLCMVSNRLAIALQEAGWWVRSEIIWAKPNPMPESTRDRPTSAHEKIWLLAKSERYFYDAEAIAEPATYADLLNQDDSGFKDPRSFNGKHQKGYRSSDKQRGHSRRHAGFNDRWDAMEKAEQCSGTRNKRNVWTIPSSSFSDAHFATFPPALIEPCILAGCPKGGTVLDPFGGAGTTGLVADRLGRNAILIELNPAYAAMAMSRVTNDLPLFAEVRAT